MFLINLIEEKDKNENDFLGIEDPNLSWKATGMLAFLLEDATEEFEIKNLVHCKTDGIKACKSGLKELEKNNYFYVIDLIKENKIIDTIYFVSPIKKPFTESLKQEILSAIDDSNNLYTLRLRNL